MCAIGLFKSTLLQFGVAMLEICFFQVVKLMMDLTADVNATDCRGLNALFIAVEGGNIEVLEFFRDENLYDIMKPCKSPSGAVSSVLS